MPRHRLPGVRTIQGRMVVIFLLLTLLAMLLIGAGLLQSLQNHYIADFQQTLDARAGGLARALGPGLDTGAPPQDIQNLIAAYGQGVGRGTVIIVVDRSVTVRGALGPTAASALVGRQYTNAQIAAVLRTGAVQETPVEKDPETHEVLMAVAAPVTDGGRLVGAVYLSGDLSGVFSTLDAIRTILIRATLLALVVMAALSFVLARTITDPIQTLTGRAQAMAAGDFDRQIEVRSEDEIGQLAGMFNHLSLRLRDTLAEISAEKQKAEAILTHMADGVLALGASGEVMLVNPVAARMLALQPHAAEGRDVAEVAPQALVDAIRSADGTPAAVRVDLAATGLVLAARVAPLHDAAGRVAGSVVVLRDMTEQERLDDLRREFVANVSHELRTPLTTVKSYVDTLLDGELEHAPVARRFLDVVADETDRMVRLISDLLQLSQMDHGRLHLERQPVDLPTLVAQVQRRLQERCRGKDIALDWSAQEGLPPVSADGDRITQVVTNLLTNAVDFTPPGGRVSVTLSRADGFVLTRVRDTGIGIPSEDLPRIFDRFYRVDKARSRQFGGTGLGLSIAKEIVEAHGGGITIASTPGEGTEVAFTLPVAEVEAL